MNQRILLVLLLLTPLAGGCPAEKREARPAARKPTVGDVRSFASDMIADHTAMQHSVGKLRRDERGTPHAPAL